MGRLDELTPERKALAEKVGAAYFEVMEDLCNKFEDLVNPKTGVTHDDITQAIKDWDPYAADVLDNWADWVTESEE